MLILWSLYIFEFLDRGQATALDGVFLFLCMVIRGTRILFRVLAVRSIHVFHTSYNSIRQRKNDNALSSCNPASTMISLFGKTFFSQHTHASGEWSAHSLRIVHARFVVFMIFMCTDMLSAKVKRPLLSLPPYTQKKKQGYTPGISS